MGLLKDRKSTNNVVARSRSIDVDAQMQVMPNIAKRFVESVVCMYMPAQSRHPHRVFQYSIYGKHRIGCGL